MQEAGNLTMGNVVPAPEGPEIPLDPRLPYLNEEGEKVWPEYDGIRVSVIVPVYNSELHLQQNLDSICAQTLPDIEIILVDDGSTDSSLAMLQSYRALDSRIQIYRQQNLFAGVARNTGKAHARGEYLVFWDSDDYFSPRALERMYIKCVEDDADICICDGNRYYDGMGIQTAGGVFLKRRFLPKPEERPFSRETHPDVILNLVSPAPWTKMFRRAFVEAEGLNYQPVRTGNDVFFVECAMCLAKRITVADVPLVYYREDQATSLIGTRVKTPLAPVYARLAIHDELVKRNAFPRKSFVNSVMGSLVYTMRNVCSSYDSFRSVVEYLQEEGLERLELLDVTEEDLYEPFHWEVLQHLKQDTPEEMMAFLFSYTYGQLRKSTARRAAQKNKIKGLTKKTKAQEKKIKKLQKRVRALRNSWSYRVGHVLMWLPGKLKRLVKRILKAMKGQQVTEADLMTAEEQMAVEDRELMQQDMPAAAAEVVGEQAAENLQEEEAAAVAEAETPEEAKEAVREAVAERAEQNEEAEELSGEV